MSSNNASRQAGCLPRTSGFLTDLYQLTMLDAYLERDMCDQAVFEFFVRRLPEQRNFLMAAGLEQLLDYLEDLAFSDEEIGWLESTGECSSRLIDYLAAFRFTGDVLAMPEGTVFFADEPVVQVIAPLPEAQLIETRLINLIHYQTMIASKAARCVLAAPDKTLVDFGLRRAHGAEAGLMAARASYIAGFAGTSTVLAKAAFEIPIYGTMAHSFVQAHAAELQAFEHFARVFPEGSVLLIDTYDTVAAARACPPLIKRLREEGVKVRAVRLDSGDLAALACEVRDILDAAGCEDISIFCSGSLDEYALSAELGDAPVDGYGIGTRLDVSADAPYLDCVYKIQEYAGTARRKRSTGKATWPGRKQVYRSRDAGGRLIGDELVLSDESRDGQALLEAVMCDGKRLAGPPSIEQVRMSARRELDGLPDSLKSLRAPTSFGVEISTALRELADSVDRASS